MKKLITFGCRLFPLRVQPGTLSLLLASAIAGGGLAFAAPPDTSAPAVETTPRTNDHPPIADYRLELLKQAFETASAIPVQPHIKDRSRMQELAALAYLELGDADRALACVTRMEDWRRGVVLADVAAHAVKHGANAEAATVTPNLEAALRIADSEEDWRRDLIRAKVAGVYLALGDTENAKRLETGLVDSEAGKTDVVRAETVTVEKFDEFAARLDSVLATGNFDLSLNAFDALIRLHDRFYDDAARRAAIEERVAKALPKLPLVIRIDLMVRLAESATKHHDRDAALTHINEAQGLLETYEWALEDRLAQMAKVAQARHAAGDHAAAHVQAHAALEAYLAGSDRIIRMFRAGALRPLAEAYQAMGDPKAALDVYKIAVEDGADNKNARPRAEDLTATCVSMALSGVEPDETLWSRIRQIHSGLDHPW